MFSRFLNKLDNSQNPQKIVFTFLFIWLIVNLLQATFTELAHDEAYYWMYSRHLDWGYFDHPPLIALLIKIGYSLFKNELGVRIITTLMGVTTVFFIFLLLKDQIKKISLLLLILLSAIIIQSHIGGFLAIPDLPVVFFSVLFFLIYKKYLQTNTWWLAVFLGIAGSGMLYSKYHGLLVLIFTLLSNLKLFKRLTFWIIPTIIVLALLPHLFWQIENHFPTFQYHLVGRSSFYKFDHTFNYIYSQLFISGPLAGIVLFYFAIKYKVQDDLFLRSMKFNFYGFFLFFFLSSFKGHVEPHWTAIGYVPVIILSYLGISENEKGQKWLRVLFIPTFIIFLFIRIALIFEILPREWKIGKEFHNWDTWAQQIKSEAGNRKVVFINSFQRPSKYSFYTGGDFSTTLNSINYRKNQYDLWNFEDSVQGKPVLLMYHGIPDDSIITDVETYKVRYFNNFRSYFSLRIIPSQTVFQALPGSNIKVRYKILNSNNRGIHIIQSEGDISPWICIMIHDGNDYLTPQYPGKITDTIPANSEIAKELEFTVPKKEGKYSFVISIQNDGIYPAYNCNPIKLIVKK